MTKRRSAVHPFVLLSVAVGAACTGGGDGDDAATPTSLGGADIEVVEVAAPEPAVVETIPVPTGTVGDPTEDSEIGTTDPVAPADTSLDPSSAATIEVLGPFEDDVSVAAIQTAFDLYGDDVGVDIDYVGTFEASLELDDRIAAGNPPDVFIGRQPDQFADLVDDGLLAVLPDDVVSASTWPADFADIYSVAGSPVAVPFSVDVKSLVWYDPAAFDEFSFSVPTTFTEFESLVSESALVGLPPLCVGIESGAATGWVYTDWVEDVVIREHGLDVYDQWATHEIPFDDDRIVSSMQTVLDLWSGENVFSSNGSISETPFADNAEPLVEGRCLMHRQADFFEFYLPDVELSTGTLGSLDVFILPSDTGSPLVVNGTAAAALTDRPEVLDLLAHIGSTRFADDRNRQFELERRPILSLAEGQDTSLLSPFSRRVVELALASDSYRFDASDSMPLAVGAGSFWEEGTRAVDGEITAAEAAAAIEASWPT